MATGELGGDNILRQVYDPPTESLKVTGVSFDFPGGIEVIIDHTNDSIRLGDGTNLITATTNASKVGLDVNLIGSSSTIPVSLAENGIGGVPSVDNVIAVISGTEYFYDIPIGATKLTIRSREKAKLQIAFQVGQTNTTFLTIPRGSSYTIDYIQTSVSQRLYFQSNINNDVLEILYWI